MSGVMKRPFLKGLLVGSIIGLIGGGAIAYLVQDRFYTMWHPMVRLAEAAESSEYTYAMYLHAPYHVAEDFLNRHASLLEQLAAESSNDLERESFLWDLSVNRARLAKLAGRHGENEKAERLIGQAMIYVDQSGRSTTQEELVWFVDQIDERTGKQTYEATEATGQESGQPDA